MAKPEEKKKSIAAAARDSLLVVGGALLGAVGALLYAPQSGEKTRKQIARKAEDIKDQAVDAGSDMLDKVEDLKRAAGKQLDAGADYAADKKDQFLGALSGLEDKLASLKKKLLNR